MREAFVFRSPVLVRPASYFLLRALTMERHRGYRHRHHEHRHSDFYQHHADRNQFNNHTIIITSRSQKALNLRVKEALLIKLVMLLLHLQYLPVPKWWVRKSVIGVGIPAQMVSSLRGF